MLPEGARTVDLDVGETVQVSFGEFSPGVGDDWGVVREEPEGVVDATMVAGSDVAGVDDADEAPGSSTPLALELTGEAAGTTTVHTLYCYRTAVEEDCDQGPGGPVEPRLITVTVR
ncbi:hypothetical protein [Brachybacterium sp. YJGR34]|uniref:hypothetical protein n=1 Tax=Brachybacterium sp. YJGR34 TaxID=2059911 RepID=UPI000E0A682E|nr:hypothetical protein [Brachybacterium sp. YJGR34]